MWTFPKAGLEVVLYEVQRSRKSYARFGVTKSHLPKIGFLT